MEQKIGRNDPCPCGSGKKYKQCCLTAPVTKKKFKATVITGGNVPRVEIPKKLVPDLMERTFGNAIAETRKEEKPPTPPGA